MSSSLSENLPLNSNNSLNGALCSQNNLTIAKSNVELSFLELYCLVDMIKKKTSENTSSHSEIKNKNEAIEFVEDYQRFFQINSEKISKIQENIGQVPLSDALEKSMRAILEYVNLLQIF